MSVQTKIAESGQPAEQTAPGVSDALVKALEQIRDLAKPGQEVSVTAAVDILCDVWNTARAALASVREVQP